MTDLEAVTKHVAAFQRSFADEREPSVASACHAAMPLDMGAKDLCSASACSVANVWAAGDGKSRVATLHELIEQSANEHHARTIAMVGDHRQPP